MCGITDRNGQELQCRERGLPISIREVKIMTTNRPTTAQARCERPVYLSADNPVSSPLLCYSQREGI